MSGRIYLLEENVFAEMNEERDREELLWQELVARHPVLLTGNGSSCQPACRCLVKRSEVTIPAKEGAGGRWRLDLFFWQKAEANFKTSVIQMLSVPENVPRELIRLVDFLNEHLDTSEVTALELSQYLDKDETVLDPSLVSKVNGTTRQGC